MTFYEQTKKALEKYDERVATLNVDQRDSDFLSGQNYIYSSELDTHEGPFFTSSQLDESVHCFAERALDALFNMKSYEEITQMSEYDRLYYLGKLAAYSEFLRDYIEEE